MDLLGEGAEANLSSKDLHPDRIKYFHFPSNNMIWAENALSRYFGETRPDRHAIRRGLKKAPKTREANSGIRPPLEMDRSSEQGIQVHECHVILTIKDIIEELESMLHITKCHRTILKQYVDDAEKILDPYGDYGRAHTKMETSSRAIYKPVEDQLSEEELQERKNGLEETKKESNERQYYTWFMLKADELRELRASAVSTADSVKDLLELKQQQAGVVQAWQAVNQASETTKQGRSIMMFTLVTIVSVRDT
ncbi:ankyrin repeat protein [Apiospora aurea]|uniref:Ankyrin repeat protein n=1 Tax=Apiospora aurea TaxID=335848 RepID=A0ABR1PTG3_9PEZI